MKLGSETKLTATNVIHVRWEQFTCIILIFYIKTLSSELFDYDDFNEYSPETTKSFDILFIWEEKRWYGRTGTTVLRLLVILPNPNHIRCSLQNLRFYLHFGWNLPAEASHRVSACLDVLVSVVKFLFMKIIKGIFYSRTKQEVNAKTSNTS